MWFTRIGKSALGYFIYISGKSYNQYKYVNASTWHSLGRQISASLNLFLIYPKIFFLFTAFSICSATFAQLSWWHLLGNICSFTMFSLNFFWFTQQIFFLIYPSFYSDLPKFTRFTQICQTGDRAYFNTRAQIDAHIHTYIWFTQTYKICAKSEALPSGKSFGQIRFTRNV